jgi:hypothetical protein
LGEVHAVRVRRRAPFGEAWGANIYWYIQEDGDGSISGAEGDHDCVVVVLDRRLGETTGWMGARGYDDDWDDLAVWSHMGYPSDLSSGLRPTWQGGFLVDGTDDAAQSILQQADVFPGQSGGPVFGFWDGDVGPCAIAVQSWPRRLPSRILDAVVPMTAHDADPHPAQRREPDRGLPAAPRLRRRRNWLGSRGRGRRRASGDRRGLCAERLRCRGSSPPQPPSGAEHS